MSGRGRWKPDGVLRRRAEAEAFALRARLGVDHTARLDIDAALGLHDFMCIDVAATSLAPLHKQCLLQDSKQTSWSALTLRGPDWKGVVYNSVHGLERQRADKAHELAHELLVHTAEVLHAIPGGLALRDYDEVKEKEASYVGGVLLVSDQSINWAVSAELTRSQMQNHFGVSPELIRYRLNALRKYWSVAA